MFSVTVTNQVPYFKMPLENQVMVIGSRLNYELPQIKDPEDMPVFVQASLNGMKFPSFIRFNVKPSLSFNFTANNLKDVGTYFIRLTISDNIGLP